MSRFICFKRILQLAVMLVLSLATVSVYSSEISGQSKRLILVQGTTLNAYYNERYIEVKRLDANDYFYGYGWLDDNKVFVAYQSGGAEAYADIEIKDLRHNKTIVLGGVGGAGETNFDVNPVTGNIIFNDSTGINVMMVDDKNSYQIKPVKQGIDCWGVFWINTKTIGCKLMSQKGAPFVKFVVP